MVSRGSRWIRACPITTAGETYFPGHLKHDWRAPFDGPRMSRNELAFRLGVGFYGLEKGEWRE
jgi:hypothetical protein